MKGSVRKRGCSWYYYFSYTDESGDRKKVERKVGTDKAEAEKALRKAIGECERGYIDDPIKTLNGYIAEWLCYIKSNRKINTYNRYKGIMDKYVIPRIGGIKINKLNALHVEKVLRSAKEGSNINNTTIEAIYLALNSALNRAYKLRIILENPCNFVEKPKRERFVGTPLDVENIGKLYKHIDTSKENGYIMALALKLLLELGLRRGELAGLQWRDTNFKNNTIQVKNNMVYSNGKTYLSTPKTEQSTRELYISDNLIALLTAHKKRQAKNKLMYGTRYIKNEFNGEICDFIMTWDNGQCVHPNYYTTRIKKLFTAAGITGNIRLHDLRHTNATLMLGQGVDFKTVQTRLGHADLATTMDIYSHVNMDMQKQAIEKLNKALGS